MRVASALAVSVVAGLAVFAVGFYVWMVFGADPANDPLLSF